SGRASMLLGAGFGEGKSHLLTHLGHLATSAGFVVSTVVISKETPLHDPAKVLRAAVESAVAPDGARDVVAEAAAALDTDGPGYAELLRWLRGPGRDMNERFVATLLLHQRLSSDAPGADEEFLDTIVRFWSGDPLLMPDLRASSRPSARPRPSRSPRSRSGTLPASGCGSCPGSCAQGDTPAGWCFSTRSS
ncbi:MAG: BREX system ATP-binding domain-containing protein, partial [Dermatophilaceae bacterium]